MTGKNIFFDKELTYAFQDTGLYHIRMIATDRFLCTDTLDTDVFIYKDFSLIHAQCVSPNGDGKMNPFASWRNTFFGIYDLKIYDRWVVSYLNRQIQRWVGMVNLKMQEKTYLPGVYVYDLYYKVN